MTICDNLSHPCQPHGMTFAPGHTINLGRSGVQRTTGARNRELRSLAMRIREDPRLDTLLERLWTMAIDGMDPTTREKIDAKTQQYAARILLERGFGMPAMHVALEGEIRSEVQLLEPPKRAGQGLTLEQLNERRLALRALGVVPKVIEALAVEHAALPEGDDEHDDE